MKTVLETMSSIRTPTTLSKEEYLELPPHERGKYLREIIRKTLEMNEQGVSVSDLEANLPFDKRAIQKHLEVLTHTNVAFKSQVGPTKLYHSNETAPHKGLEDEFQINGKTYGLYTVENRLGEFVLIQESKNDDIQGGILVPISDYGTFVDHVNKMREAISDE